MKSDKNTNENITADDQFYTSYQQGNYTRIPLIKPYELISSDDGFTWSFLGPDNIRNEEKLILQYISLAGIEDSMIVVYTKMTSLTNEMSQVWCFINTKQRVEKFYANESDFTKCLEENNISNIKLHSTDSLFKRFKEKGETVLKTQ